MQYDGGAKRKISGFGRVKFLGKFRWEGRIHKYANELVTFGRSKNVNLSDILGIGQNIFYVDKEHFGSLAKIWEKVESESQMAKSDLLLAQL